MTANRIIFNSIYPGERQSPLSFLLIAKVVVDGNLKYQGLNLFLFYIILLNTSHISFYLYYQTLLSMRRTM